MQIMAIPYSLALRLAKPGFPEKGNKTYPVAQYYQLLDLGKMAAHMAGHASKYSKGDIMAVTTELTSCIREQLLLGNKVQLGDLGAFSVTLISNGADNAESFSTSLIQKVKVHWEPSAEFTDLLNDCEFEFVGTREAQAAARKAEKERLNEEATIKPGEEDNAEDETPTPDVPDTGGTGNTPPSGEDDDEGLAG